MVDFADDPGGELKRKADWLKWAALAETISYCFLFYFWVDGHTAGKAITGSIHGMLWLAFAAMLVMITTDIGWSWRYAALVLLTGPIGGVLVFARLSRFTLEDATAITDRHAAERAERIHAARASALESDRDTNAGATRDADSAG